MKKLSTYKDFADNSYSFFMYAYDNNQLFNEMGFVAQNICERYLKHVILEFAEPEDDLESLVKTKVLRSHNLKVLMNYLRDEMKLTLSDELINKLNSINGFYFSTRYPGEDSITLTWNDLDDCASAIKFCKEFTESVMIQLNNN